MPLKSNQGGELVNLGEIVLISCGLCLDLFTVMVCQGAILPKISRKVMAVFCLIFGVWQIVFLVLGNLITRIPILQTETTKNIENVWRMVSSLIFFGIGVYFAIKAMKSKTMEETRSDGVKIKTILFYAFVVSLDVFFAGIGFGFLNTSLLKQVAAMACITILAIFLGTFIGYRLGAQNKNKAYAAGGILLFIGAVESFMRFSLLF